MATRARKQPAKSKTSRVRRKARAREPAAPSQAGRRGRAAGRASAPGAGVVAMRMYRGLLGDFFLVTHTVEGREPFKMLVDCGVLQCIGKKEDKPTTAMGKDRIKAAVADLMTNTGGKIDIVVATHEHYDHLSGFILANDAFKSLEIGKVWMAWTEDRSDPLANSYRRKKNKALKALVALAQMDAFAATSEMATVTNLLQFYGDLRGISDEGMAVAKVRSDGGLAGNASCEAVLEWLRTKVGVNNVAYLNPGDVVRWGVDDAFRAYVLGPPRDDRKLRKLDPTKGQGKEVYLARNEDVETVLGLAAIHGSAAGQEQLRDQPFARLHWRPYGQVAKGTRRRQSEKDSVQELYERGDEADRKIDHEWLGSAENLALKIDGDVNNTSLVLALEMPKREVFLFAADAQVGNWLSWADQTYPANDAKDAPQQKIDHLLARTVFYKVGHHASHNATLRDGGLELMTDPRLSAMIPVVEKTAREQKTKNAPKGWSMPYGDLFQRLEERTAGRILRGDGKTGEETAAFKKSMFDLSYGPNFKPRDPLWVQLALSL